MKRFNPSNLILASLFLVFSCSVGGAQTPRAALETETAQAVSAPAPERPNLLRELNLTQAQIRRIRRLNQERRPLMQASQRRLREANQALDRAIYADAENEAEIQSRMNELHSAQMEVIKNRTQTELAVRQILTPEQLHRFRNLREEFMQSDNAGNPANQRRRNNLRNLPGALRRQRPARLQNRGRGQQQRPIQ